MTDAEYRMHMDMLDSLLGTLTLLPIDELLHTVIQSDTLDDQRRVLEAAKTLRDLVLCTMERVEDQGSGGVW